MFYDLIVHPSRVEFVHRVFSSEKNEFSKKIIATRDLDFKFDLNVIEKGDHCESFKKILKEMIDPVRSELNSINIVIKSSFFQIKTITCDINKADYLEYINWEAYQMVTDLPDRYKFGSAFLDNEQKLVVVVVRKIVSDYIQGIFYELYSDKLEFKIGYLFSLANNEDIFISTEKQLSKPFKYDKSPEKDYSPASIVTASTSKGNKKPIIYIFLLLAAAAVSVYVIAPKFIGGKQIQTDNTAIPADTPVTAKAEIVKAEPEKITAEPIVQTPVKTEPTKEDIKIEPKKDVEPVVSPEVIPPALWDYIKSLTKLNSDSIVFNNGEVSIYLINIEDIKKIHALDESKVLEYKSDDKLFKIKHKSFAFKNYKSETNYNNFVDIKNDYNLVSEDNTYKFITMKEFHIFINVLKQRKIGFKKFSIVKQLDSVTFTVYFD